MEKDTTIMELCIQESDLLKELELAQGAVEKGYDPHPFARAPGSGGFSLRISATDLELGARSNCPANPWSSS